METLREWFDFFRDPIALINAGGYIALTLIVFTETGLLIGFFLPGDSLLVTAGLLASTKVGVDLDLIWLNVLLIPACIADACSCARGSAAG